MKFKSCLLTGFLGGLLIACNDANIDPNTFVYTLENEADQGVTILGYYHYSSELNQELVLPSGGQIQRDSTVHPLNGSWIEPDFLGGDSIILVFDDQKRITYRCIRGQSDPECQAPRNILNSWNVETAQGRKERFVYYDYTITQADYERAQ